MSAYYANSGAKVKAPRVVVMGLASCYGCQLQITNAEPHLLDILDQINLSYWQLTSSDPLPDEFDVAIIEGAVTTTESVRSVIAAREKAACVIAIGACATTGGIPGMAAADLEHHAASVYDGLPAACGELVRPHPVSSIIDVDYEVRCCPIDTMEFVRTLNHVLYGSNRTKATRTMCGDCKLNENQCFYSKGIMCLGLVTRAGCNARCVNLGRPCNGCAGLSPDAQLDSARQVCRDNGISVERFDEALGMFNAVDGKRVTFEQSAADETGKGVSSSR